MRIEVPDMRTLIMTPFDRDTPLCNENAEVKNSRK